MPRRIWDPAPEEVQAIVRRAWHVLLAAVGGTVLLLAGFAWLDGLSRPVPEAKRPLTGDERAEVLEAVRLFNAIWRDFYATGGIPTMIDAMPATKMVKHGIFRDTGFLLQNERFLVYDLARAVPLEVTSGAPDEAEVLLYEEWNYVYQDRATRKPVTPVKGMGQGFRYELARNGGRWAIHAWAPEDVPGPPAEGFVW
jgi:hypothetical protein